MPIDASALLVPLLIWFKADQTVAAVLVVSLSALYVSVLKIPKLFK